MQSQNHTEPPQKHVLAVGRFGKSFDVYTPDGDLRICKPVEGTPLGIDLRRQRPSARVVTFDPRPFRDVTFRSRRRVA